MLAAVIMMGASAHDPLAVPFEPVPGYTGKSSRSETGSEPPPFLQPNPIPPCADCSQMDPRSFEYVAKPDCTIPPKQAGTVTISCVGDSITAGGWPQIMQQNLNTKYGVGAYNVINFGECGSTMQRHADSPYDQRPSWPKVLNTSSDIIVIMLGTNDAKDLSDGGPPNWENNGVTGQAREACQPERLPRIPHTPPAPPAH